MCEEKMSIPRSEFELFGDDAPETQDFNTDDEEETDNADETDSIHEFVVSDGVVEQDDTPPVVNLQGGLQTRVENGLEVRRSTRERRGVKRYLDADYMQLMLADVPEEEQSAALESEPEEPAPSAESAAEEEEEEEDTEEEEESEAEDTEEDEQVIANHVALILQQVTRRPPQ